LRVSAPAIVVRLIMGEVMLTVLGMVIAPKLLAVKDVPGLNAPVKVSEPAVVVRLILLGAVILVPLIVVSPPLLAVKSVPALAVPLNTKGPLVAVKLMAPVVVARATPGDTVSPLAPTAVKEVEGLRL
jgi:hypothetical protein